MRTQILIELASLEKQHEIVILYAVESGSRAWGFASTNSDWDVRFIYVHKHDWYLSIDQGKDSIEKILPNDIDLSGWDLRKALQLFRKSNPPLLEWLRSPITYLEKYDTASILREYTQEYFNPKSCLHHYLHMAEGNFRESLQQDLAPIKKYFYVLRPVLACQWIESTNTMPPMEFQTLLSQIKDENLKQRIENLLVRKRNGEELSKEPKIKIINDFLEERINYFNRYVRTFDTDIQPNDNKLDNLFRYTIDQTSTAKTSGSATL